MVKKFHAFIIYETYSGKDLAEHLKESLIRVKRNAFVASIDIPLGANEKEFRYSTLKEVNDIIFIVTQGALTSEEVKNEIKFAVENGKGENIIPFLYREVPQEEVKEFFKRLGLGIKQWGSFDTKEELARKVQAWYNTKPNYIGGLLLADRPVFDPFLEGTRLMGEYKWDEAIDNFRVAVAKAKGSHKVALLNLIGNCFYARENWNRLWGIIRSLWI